MPSLRTIRAALVGPTVAERHQAIMDEIESRQARLRESPAIKANLASKRERLRAAENQLPKLSAAMRGLSEPHWSAQAQTTREEMSALRREIEDLAAEIAADEAALSEIASAALPEVTPALLAFHRERVSEAQANVAKIRDALDASKAELAALEAASDPVIDLRRQLADTLAMQALGSASAEDVSAIEEKIAASENVASATSARSQRLAATVAGLEQRLSQAQADLDRLDEITPIMQAAHLAPEIRKAETAYAKALAALVASNDTYRALRHMLSAINPDTAFPTLAEPTTALRDAGQLRLAQAIEREQARLSAMGI